MRVRAASLVLAVLCACAAVFDASAEKEHVLVLLGETEFEKAIKVRVSCRFCF